MRVNSRCKVLCSACNKPIFASCYHYPGERLKLTEQDDGGKRLVRDRAGDVTVEWIYTAGELVETSAVSVPAVPSAHIEAIRAALSADVTHGAGPSPQENEMNERLIKLLCLAATASEDEILTAVEAKVGKVDSLAKELAIADAERSMLSAEVEIGRKAQAERDEDAFIATALSEGRIDAGEQDLWRDLFKADATRASSRMTERKPGQRTPAGQQRQADKAAPTVNPVVLSDRQLKFIVQMGMTPETYVANLAKGGHIQ